MLYFSIHLSSSSSTLFPKPQVQELYCSLTSVVFCGFHLLTGEGFLLRGESIFITECKDKYLE